MCLWGRENFPALLFLCSLLQSATDGLCHMAYKDRLTINQSLSLIETGQLTPDKRPKLRCFNHQHWQNLFTSFTQVTIVTTSSIPWLTSTSPSNLGFSQLNEPDQAIFKMHHYLKRKGKANQALSKLAPHYDPVTAVTCFRFPLDDHKFSINDVNQKEIICKECCSYTSNQHK